MPSTELPVLEQRHGRLVRFPDSVDKLVHHLACLAPEQEVTYQGKALIPRPPTEISIGVSLFRRFICADGCTSCCLPFTLDYTPAEFAKLPRAQRDLVPWAEREVEVSGRRHTVLTFNQAPLPSCPYLTRVLPHGEGLGCDLWPRSPIECAAAPQVTIRYQKPGVTFLVKRPFGYGWRFTPPAACAFESEDDERALRMIVQKDATLLERYLHWADYFEVDTVLPELIAVLRSFKTRTMPLPRRDGQAIAIYPLLKET